MSRINPVIGGVEVQCDAAEYAVISPTDGSVTATFPDCPPDIVDQAVRNAAEAFRANRRSTRDIRAGWLRAAAAKLKEKAGAIEELLVRDIGKPRRASRFEAGRSGAFLDMVVAELVTERGEVLPLDAAPAGAGRFGYATRIPYGVVGVITPFNAPINLLVQKVGPALAAGNAVVMKPHPHGTAVARLVMEAFDEAGLPKGMLNLVTGDRAPAAALAEHRDVSALSFTGGTDAADALVRLAGAKKFVGELGSNAANIVLADADLDDAAKRIAGAAFEASGQQCISAQRIIVAESVFDAFLTKFVEAAKVLKVGPADDDSVDLGPMISSAAADRVMEMVADAAGCGAEIALAPERTDCVVSPGILCRCPPDARLLNEEAFGPVVTVQPARDADDALAQANRSAFGLQGSVFTRDLATAFRFADEFETGCLWVNEASRFRLDMYPFGGVKRSGVGREGVRYALEELSQIKFVGIRLP